MLISTCKPTCTSKYSYSGEQLSQCPGSRDLGTGDSSPPNYLARATETLFLAMLLAWLVRKMKYSPGGRNPIVFRTLEWSRSCEWLHQTFLLHVWRISEAHRLIAELWVQHLKALGGILRKCLTIIKTFLHVRWIIWFGWRNFCQVMYLKDLWPFMCCQDARSWHGI